MAILGRNSATAATDLAHRGGCRATALRSHTGHRRSEVEIAVGQFNREVVGHLVGEAGVDRALDLLSREFKSTMQFLGVTSVAELRKHGRDLITRAAS